MRTSRWATIGVAVLLSCTLRGGAAAQTPAPTRIVDLHVNVERENRSVNGSVPEGGRFYLTVDRDGMYAISPRQHGTDARTFRVTVLRAVDPGAEEPEFRTVEVVTATLGTPVALRSPATASVVIEGTRAPRLSAARASGWTLASNVPGARSVSQDRCCIRCGSVEACGCAVSHDCGSCCVAPCCDVDPPDAHRVASPAASAGIRFASTARACAAVPDHERLYPPTAGIRNLRISRE